MPEVYVELAAANLYRGTLRMNRDGQTPSIFSLAMWHNDGLYAAILAEATQSRVDKATGYANAVLGLVQQSGARFSPDAYSVPEEARYIWKDLFNSLSMQP